MSTEQPKEVAPEEESTATFTPLYDLNEVSVSSGEENEVLLWSHRCALYRFTGDVSGTNMWCDRGRGDVKIMRHKETNKPRIILREDKTGKVRLNSYILPEQTLEPNPGSDKAWTWACKDHSEGNEEGKDESMAIRFKDAETANLFKSNFDMAKMGKFEELLAALSLGKDEKKEDEKENEAEVAETEAQQHEKDVALWSKVMKETQSARMSEETLKELWSTFDKDKSGYIDSGELKELFDALVEAFANQLGDAMSADTAKTLKAVVPGLAKANMVKLDKNKDNKVSWEEFLALEDVALTLPL